MANDLKVGQRIPEEDLQIGTAIPEEDLSFEGDLVGQDVDTPRPESPLTVGQRFRLKGLGNERGRLNYLRRNFEGLYPHPDHGLLVKHEGNWHQVDPGFRDILKTGDPWKVSKELAKDMADLGDVALNAIIVGKGALKGGAAGLAVGGPPAAVVGGLLGAGAAGVGAAAVRTSLGRLAGTYEATPEEEIKDLALEGVLSLGGEATAIGARPTLLALSRAATRLKNTIITDSAIQIYGKLTGTGEGAMRELMDNAPAVIRGLKKNSRLAKPGEHLDQAIDRAREKLVSKIDNYLDKADKVLPSKYGEILDDILSTADQRKLKVNFTEVTDDVYKQIEDMGLGKIVSTKTGRDFVPFSPGEVASRRRLGLNTELVDSPEAIRHLKTLTKNIDSFRTGELHGKNAAKQLQELNRSINRTLKAVDRRATPEVERLVKIVQGKTREAVGKEFDKVGLANKYTEMQDLYLKFDRSVSQARKLRDNEVSDVLIDRMLNDNAAGRKTVGTMKRLGQLVPNGEAINRELMLDAATLKFMPYLPKFGLLQTGVALSMPIVGLSQISPRIVARQTQLAQYLSRNVNFLRLLNPQQLDELTGSKAAFDTLIRSTFIQGVEENLTEDLTDSALESVHGQSQL